MQLLPVRILGIVPYETMGTSFVRAAENFPDVSIEVFTADMEACKALLQECQQSQYDCILSQGENTQVLKQAAMIPVIEVQYSILDVKHTLDLAKNYTDKIAVVSFSNITQVSHTLCNLMKYQIPIHTVTSYQQLHNTIESLHAQGIEMFLGGAATHDTAQKLGYHALVITSDAEGVTEAIRQAAGIGRNFQRLRTENLFLTAFMSGESENLTVLDAFGNPYYATPVSLQPELIGVLREKIPEIPVHAPLRFYYRYCGKLYRIVAQRMQIGLSIYFLFHYSSSSDPVRGGKAGMRIFSKSECDIIFRNSIFSLSGALGNLRSQLDTLASVQDAVMIAGEGGTGKIQIAHYLYLRGSNSNKSFVLVDCASASDKTWEILLNRHDSPLLDTGNTVCFQNFQAISPTNGGKLLELILSTRNHLRQRLIFCYDITDGEAFSEIYHALMHSISCIPIMPQPLRLRSDEIAPLSSLYLGQLNLELSKQISGFEPGALEQLCRYNWPGNLMQLKRVLRELAIREDTFYIRTALVSEVLTRERTSAGTTRSIKKQKPAGMTLDEIIHSAVLEALDANNGNQSATAKQLGIGRSTLWRHINSGRN